MDEAPHKHACYADRLEAMKRQIPQSASERLRWYRGKRHDPSVDQGLLRHAFLGIDSSWDEDALVAPDPEYLRNVQPGWMWVRIDNNSKANYITSGYALNLADPSSGGVRADWHSTCWQVPRRGVHPRSRDCISAQASPLRGRAYYAETSKVLGDRGVFDARRSLRGLGHPAGDRPCPVWAADHCRAIVDQAWNAMRKGILPVERHVTPYLVARWLWTDNQFQELLDMASSLGSLAVGQAGAQWQSWIHSLSPDATFGREMGLDRKPSRDGHSLASSG